MEDITKVTRLTSGQVNISLCDRAYHLTPVQKGSRQQREESLNQLVGLYDYLRDLQEGTSLSLPLVAFNDGTNNYDCA